MTEQNINVLNKPKGLGTRHLQLFMWFFAVVAGYWIRINMNMAIVAMTDSSLENHFDWDVKTKSIILASFYWGYAVLQIPSGEIATRYGGRILIIISMSISSVVTLLIPYSSYYGGWQLVCACRFVQGLFQGLLLPAIYNLVGKWTPPEEKSRTGALVLSDEAESSQDSSHFLDHGTRLGTATQMLLAGLIAAWWGWPAIFYVNGMAGIVWTIVYTFVGADTPQQSKLIRDEERSFIQRSLGQTGKPKKLNTPWKAVGTSVPFLCIIVSLSCQTWGFWTLTAEIPLYLNNVLGVNIKTNAVMSSLPYFAAYLLIFPFGYISDYVINKQLLSATATRKLSNTIGSFGAAAALTCLTYVPPGKVILAVLVLITIAGLNVGNITGVMIVHLDLAPNYAGTLLGITNTFSNGITFMAPVVAGNLIRDEMDANDWRNFFFVASGLWVFGNILFLLFGSSEKQPWNDAPEDSWSNATDESAGKQIDDINKQ